jgi:stearoyl-CoA desaturase (Delta-9 desaturase)
MALGVDVASPIPRKATPVINEMPLTPPQSPPPEKRADNHLEPSDIHIPDNYVQHTLATVPALPPIKLRNILKEIQWISFTALTVTPILAIYGAFTTKLRWETALFSVFWYYVTGCAGY